MSLVPETKEKAEFFGVPGEKDYEEFKREEEGMKPWYERLKNL